MILPENGSVVVIDEKIEEALPIIKALSKAGIPTTFYNGIIKDELPESPTQIVRLVFLDLQLVDGVVDEHQIATSLINVLKKIISENNGPYILVIWSKNYEKYGKKVEEEVKKINHKIVPACIVKFDKRECLDEKKIELTDVETLSSEILSSVEGRIDDEEKTIIENKIKEAIEARAEYQFEARPNALQLIENAIKTELQKAGIMHLFILWENMVKRASAKIVKDISEIVPVNETWEFNIRDIFKRMGIARVGQAACTKESLIKESINTFNSSFIDQLETEIKKETFPEYITLEGDILLSEKIDNTEYTLKKDGNGEAINKGDIRLIKADNRDGLIKSLSKDPKIDSRSRR